jgi:hypothetical protein
MCRRFSFIAAALIWFASLAALALASAADFSDPGL